MARQPRFHSAKRWRNFHQTYEQIQQGTWDLFDPGLGGSQTVASFRETTAQFHGLIAEAERQRIPLRAVGSRWSLSRAPAMSGWTINTNRLRGGLKVASGDIDTAYRGSADQRSGLFIVQCGNTVADVNEIIESRTHQRALLTSGAANGQTFVGATATGTHGSALSFGALHDHIVGLHLIIAGGRHYWIERASRPVMGPGWSAALGAELVRDDALFDAAAMSFGAFGMIRAVAIETGPRYLLHAVPGREKLDERLWSAITELDFSRHPFFAGRSAPYFFQAIINPADDEVLLNANYSDLCPTSYVPRYGLTQDTKSIGPGFDSLSMVGLILDHFRGIVPPIARIAAANLFDMTPRRARRARFTATRRPNCTSPAEASPWRWRMPTGRSMR